MKKIEEAAVNYFNGLKEPDPCGEVNAFIAGAKWIVENSSKLGFSADTGEYMSEWVIAHSDLEYMLNEPAKEKKI